MRDGAISKAQDAFLTYSQEIRDEDDMISSEDLDANLIQSIEVKDFLSNVSHVSFIYMQQGASFDIL